MSWNEIPGSILKIARHIVGVWFVLMASASIWFLYGFIFVSTNLGLFAMTLITGAISFYLGFVIKRLSSKQLPNQKSTRLAKIIYTIIGALFFSIGLAILFALNFTDFIDFQTLNINEKALTITTTFGVFGLAVLCVYATD
jgi:hypothetical protein